MEWNLTRAPMALAIAGAAALALAQASEPRDPAAARALADARAAAAGLSGELRALLAAELGSGGPAAAVKACANGAQATTAEFRRRTGRDVRRVSLRNRSALNAPDELERRVLESFDRLPAGARTTAEHWEVVREAGRETLRYLKPVVTSTACLACHGARESLPEPVRAALAAAYPTDRAIGFAEGDVRGAISVRIPLAAAESLPPR
jgi:hypothetical protein